MKNRELTVLEKERRGLDLLSKHNVCLKPKAFDYFINDVLFFEDINLYPTDMELLNYMLHQLNREVYHENEGDLLLNLVGGDLDTFILAICYGSYDPQDDVVQVKDGRFYSYLESEVLENDFHDVFTLYVNNLNKAFM